MTIIRLDLAALQASQQITPEEAARLAGLALPDRRGGLAINLLLIFGAVAVAAASIALVPDAATGLLLALAALGASEALRRLVPDETFALLAGALALMGTLGLTGWVGWEFRAAPNASMPAALVTFVLVAGALWYRSAFLAALGVLALGAVFGTGTGYWHASYALFVEEPLITIGVFGALSAGLYRLRGEVPATWAGVVTVAARTALILVHFGFWVGSLWGDVLGDAWTGYYGEEAGTRIQPWIFGLGWAAASLALAFRAGRGGFVSVSAIVFLAIHGYTQYFETFGAEPVSLLVAGLTLVGLALAVSWFIRRQRKAAVPPA